MTLEETAMTPSPVPESPVTGVTHRDQPGASPPGAPTGAVRFLPPTAQEVGRAAAWCFDDTESDAQIAQRLGIARRTLARWKKRSDFAAAMAALQVWQEMVGERVVAVEDPEEAASPGQRSRDAISHENPNEETMEVRISAQSPP